MNNNKIHDIAATLGCQSAVIYAVTTIESSGEGFSLIDNIMRPVIRPEAAWFGKLTKYKFNEAYPNISSREWNLALAAKDQAEAWDQYIEMADLDADAAVQATSWGAFQIMGFNWKSCGVQSLTEFVDKMKTEDGQIETFIAFITSNPRILQAMRTKDWQTIETLYNGGGFGGAYATKLMRAYESAPRDDNGVLSA